MEPVSRTFHGRDIFAPVAAHLSLGMRIDQLGAAADPSELASLSLPVPKRLGERELVGEIVAFDRFGNIITNIGEYDILQLSSGGNPGALVFDIGGSRIGGLSTHYSAVAQDGVVGLIGSRGYLEIAVNGGSAKSRFGAEKGDCVKVSSDTRME